MPPTLPTVSTSGWVNDIAEKADRLLSYYFVSDYSQSNAYRGQIVSLPQQVQEFGHDALALERSMKAALETYFGQYFESAQVDVNTEVPNPQDPNRIQVKASLLGNDQGHLAPRTRAKRRASIRDAARVSQLRLGSYRAQFFASWQTRYYATNGARAAQLE